MSIGEAVRPLGKGGADHGDEQGAGAVPRPGACAGRGGPHHHEQAPRLPRAVRRRDRKSRAEGRAARAGRAEPREHPAHGAGRAPRLRQDRYPGEQCRVQRPQARPRGDLGRLEPGPGNQPARRVFRLPGNCPFHDRGALRADHQHRLGDLGLGIRRPRSRTAQAGEAYASSR